MCLPHVPTHSFDSRNFEIQTEIPAEGVKKMVGKGKRKRIEPLLNSLRTSRKPVLVSVFLTKTGVIVLSFHLSAFDDFGSLYGAAASWKLKLMYGGTFGKRLGLRGHCKPVSEI